jgi:flagellar assembly factor FliW
MKLDTTNFGTIEIQESSALEFPEGLPGFEHCRRFAALESSGAGGLIFLQSLEQPQLCFVTVPVRAIWPDYEITIAAEDKELLGFDAGAPIAESDLIVLAILSFVEGEEPTANLSAPVVIHAHTRRAMQVVRQDGRYEVREPLPESEAVCS